MSTVAIIGRGLVCGSKAAYARLQFTAQTDIYPSVIGTIQGTDQHHD
jgi:hypothetical protein